MSKLEIDGVSASELERIYTVLRGFSQLDFRAYKEQTIVRRILRRIAMVNCADCSEYLNLLDNNPVEIELLFNDLLIEVTSFFRDPEAFEFLATNVVADIIEKSRKEVRIWVPACATGQEAYSLAILFYEGFKKLDRKPDFRIFATDISQEAINFASAGIFFNEMFDENISADMVERYFYSVDENRRRVHPRIRSKISFFRHNLLADPPFPYIDLISCRNLLIYFNPSSQQQVISTFHFALNPDAHLFLGSSESLNELAYGFETIDSRWRIFKKKANVKLPFEVHKFKPTPIDLEKYNADSSGSKNSSISQLLNIYDSLLSNIVSPGILVDRDFEIIHINGDVMKFFPGVKGRLSSKLLAWAAGELRISLSSAMKQSQESMTKTVFKQVPVSGSAYTGKVKVAVSPFKSGSDLYYFVQILPVDDVVDTRANELDFELGQEAGARIDSLEDEVRELQHALYSALDQKKSSQEELQASNEELRASNEELQSSNEELQVISQEHEKKIRELASLNNDINNLLQSTDVAAVFLDSELRIRRFTDEACRLLSIDATDIDRHLVNIRNELIDFAHIESDVKAVLIGGAEPIEKEIESKNQRSFLYRVLPYRDEKNEINGVVLTYTDVTALRKAQVAAAESKAEYQAAVEAVNDAIWSYSVEDDSFACSDRWFSMLGVTKPEISIGFESMFDYLHKSERKAVAEAFAKSVKTGDPLNIEFRHPSSENGGGWKWIEARFRCIDRDENGRPKRFMGTGSDVTARKRAEEDLKNYTLELKKQRSILSDLIENMPLAVMAIDPADEFAYCMCNPAAEMLFGMHHKQIIGRRCCDFFAPEQARMSEQQNRMLLKNPRVINLGEMTLKLREREREVKTIKIPVLNAEREVELIFVIFEDITEEKSLERQLHHSQKLDALGRLAGCIAHDFNNMLQAIVGYSTLLGEELGDNETAVESLGFILKAADQAGSLVRQLMNFSRNDPLKKTVVNIHEVVSDLSRMLARLLEENITFNTVCETTVACAFADSEQIKQALINLCINARDAMADGGNILLKLQKVAYTLDDKSCPPDLLPGRYVVISVADTGPGIPEDLREKVFEPFFTTKGPGKGTGLGLATVYAIVRKHDGVITLATGSAGTTFTIYLPEVEEEETGGTDLDTIQKAGKRFGTVLLAEDEPMVRSYAATILKRAGYQVLLAADGREALEIFKANADNIDMLVFDVMMPAMNGRQAYDEIRKLRSDIPILFCSGYGDDLLKSEYMVEIDGRLLPKPYRSNELLNEVARMLPVERSASAEE